MSANCQLVFCTCPDTSTAQRLAQELVENYLAACVNILPGLTSVYRWQDKIETAQEQLLIIKTQKECYPQLEAWVRERHPYTVPEIIAVDIQQGLPDYLKWIVENTGIVS